MASFEEGGLENHFVDLVNTLVQKHELHVVAHPKCAHRFDERVIFHAVDFSKSRKHPGVLWSLYKTLKRIPADVVHVHANKACAMVRLVKPWLSMPFVATVHSLKRDTSVFRSFDHIIAVSKGAAKDLPGNKTTVIYNGRNMDLPARSSGEHDGVKLLAIGRLVDVKGFDILIASMAQVSSDVPVKLCIAGDGHKKAELMAQAQKLDVEQRVEFLGNRSDVPQLIADSDVVIISSRREGFPLVLVEALLTQRPVISTRVPGAREILPDSLLVEPENPAALAKCIEKVARDLEQTNEQLQPVYEFAQQELTLNQQLLKTESLLVKLVEDKGRKQQ